MPRFSFLKIIDRAILPSVLAAAAKLGGIFIAQIYSGGIVNSEQNSFVSSFADSFLLLVLVLGFGWVIVKAHHFHLSHIHPARHAKLTQQGLSHLIEDSDEIYHQALVWLSLTWFSFFLILIEAYLGGVYFWVPVSAFLVAFSLTFLLGEDIMMERSLTKNVNHREDH